MFGVLDTAALGNEPSQFPGPPWRSAERGVVSVASPLMAVPGFGIDRGDHPIVRRPRDGRVRPPAGSSAGGRAVSALEAGRLVKACA